MIIFSAMLIFLFIENKEYSDRPYLRAVYEKKTHKTYYLFRNGQILAQHRGIDEVILEGQQLITQERFQKIERIFIQIEQNIKKGN